MHTPLVSILMTAYNRALLLPRSINSVLAQTERDWELVILDDGSTDNTRQVAEGYIKDDARIRYYFHANQGPALTLNRGLQEARGTYVTILCSDDAYTPDHLATRLQYLFVHSDIGFIHGGVQIIGDEYVPDKDDPTKRIHLSQCAIGGTFFAKRAVFLKAGGFRPRGLGGDADMLERVTRQVEVAKVDFQTYVYYRDTPGSRTERLTPTKNTV